MKNDHGSYLGQFGQKPGLCYPLHYIEDRTDSSDFHSCNISDSAFSQDPGWKKERESQRYQTLSQSIPLDAFDSGAIYGNT